MAHGKKKDKKHVSSKGSYGSEQMVQFYDSKGIVNIKNVRNNSRKSRVTRSRSRSHSHSHSHSHSRKLNDTFNAKDLIYNYDKNYNKKRKSRRNSKNSSKNAINNKYYKRRSSHNKRRSSCSSTSSKSSCKSSRSSSTSRCDGRGDGIRCFTCVPSHHYNQNILPNNPYGLYSKVLPHDADGYVNKSVYIQYYRSLKKQSIEQLNFVPLGGSTKLLDPPSAWSGDVQEFVKHKNFSLPKLCSSVFAAYMVEIYTAATVRDVPFLDYPFDVQIAKSVVDIANLSQYKGPTITYDTIFRGESNGDLIGPYISQLLLLDYELGGIVNDQRYPTFATQDFMYTLPSALSVQNGIVTESLAPLLPPRYIITGRDLAAFVRENQLLYTFLRVVGVLFNANAPFNAGIPINYSFTGDANFGRPNIDFALGAVTRYALLAASCLNIKGLFIRPEEVGIIVNRFKANLNLTNNPKLGEELTNSPILDDIYNTFGSYLLPQVYPEGSPACPSYPSGRATVAGACITVLKFFFSGQWIMNLFEPDITGQTLVSTGMMSNLTNELDKLASNIGFGRMFAGVNYRMDVIAGIKLGEEVALYFLREHVKNYPQQVNIQMSLYNGDITYVTNRL